MGHNGRLLAQLHGTFTPAWFSHGHARCLRRFERSDYDGKGVSLSCLYVVARKLPHLLYGPVFSAPLFPTGKASWRTSRTARHRQNVSVLPYDAPPLSCGHICQGSSCGQRIGRNVERE